jgi:hypothetical protein
MEDDIARSSITTCADLLAQHTKIHYLSVAMTAGVVLTALLLAGLGSLTKAGAAVSASAVLAGVIETVMALRVGFDAALLRRLGERRGFTAKDLQDLDHALLSLKFMPAHKTGRSLDLRLHGCMGLFKQQVLWCAVQLLTVLCAIAWTG